MEIFPIFQHKVEGTPHFARVSEVRHIYLFIVYLYIIISTNNIKKYLNNNIYYLGIKFFIGIFIVNIYLEYFSGIFVPAVTAFSVRYNLMKGMLNRP